MKTRFCIWLFVSRSIKPAAWWLLFLNRILISSQKLDPIPKHLPPCPQAVTASALLFQTTGDISQSLNIFCYLLCVSPHTHYSGSWLSSHKLVLLLPNITSHRCNKLNPATFLPEDTDESNGKDDGIALTDDFYILEFFFKIAMWEILI